MPLHQKVFFRKLIYVVIYADEEANETANINEDADVNATDADYTHLFKQKEGLMAPPTFVL